MVFFFRKRKAKKKGGRGTKGKEDNFERLIENILFKEVNNLEDRTNIIFSKAPVNMRIIKLERNNYHTLKCEEEFHF